MEQKTINLEKILDLHLSLSSQTIPQKQFYVSAMRDACKQVLELAAENAFIDYEDVAQNENQYLWLREYPEINKQSILNTINQIE